MMIDKNMDLTPQEQAISGHHKVRQRVPVFDDFIPKFQGAIDKSIIVRCLWYAGDGDVDICCNEILSCLPGTFVQFFDSLVESDNGDAGGLDGRFFADLYWYSGNPADFRALKVLLSEEVMLFRETACFGRETNF